METKEHTEVIKIAGLKTLYQEFNFVITNLLTKESPNPEIFIQW